MGSPPQVKDAQYNYAKTMEMYCRKATNWLVNPKQNPELEMPLNPAQWVRNVRSERKVGGFCLCFHGYRIHYAVLCRGGIFWFSDERQCGPKGCRKWSRRIDIRSIDPVSILLIWITRLSIVTCPSGAPQSSCFRKLLNGLQKRSAMPKLNVCCKGFYCAHRSILVPR